MRRTPPHDGGVSELRVVQPPRRARECADGHERVADLRHAGGDRADPRALASCRLFKLLDEGEVADDGNRALPASSRSASTGEVLQARGSHAARDSKCRLGRMRPLPRLARMQCAIPSGSRSMRLPAPDPPTPKSRPAALLKTTILSVSSATTTALSICERMRSLNSLSEAVSA